MPSQTTALITGITGQDGSYLTELLLAKGYEAGAALQKELQEHVKQTTAPYKYPRMIEFVSELPKTISGKIRRVEIRDRDRSAD